MTNVGKPGENSKDRLKSGYLMKLKFFSESTIHKYINKGKC